MKKLIIIVNSENMCFEVQNLHWYLIQNKIGILKLDTILLHVAIDSILE